MVSILHHLRYRCVYVYFFQSTSRQKLEETSWKSPKNTKGVHITEEMLTEEFQLYTYI